MTLPIYKNGDPLYTIILRDQEARNQLTRWAQSSKTIQARVEDNRMHLFNHNSLMIFVVTWAHSWDNILVWDTYQKRHIYF
jgi:hypothetical protein